MKSHPREVQYWIERSKAALAHEVGPPWLFTCGELYIYIYIYNTERRTDHQEGRFSLAGERKSGSERKRRERGRGRRGGGRRREREGGRGRGREGVGERERERGRGREGEGE